MESRKVIQSGPSSLVVSLPTRWVKENGLKKGAFLDVEQLNNDLLLKIRKSTDKAEQEKKRYVLKGKEPYVLQEELMLCFLNNVDEIEVPSKVVKEVIPLLDKVPGLEIKLNTEGTMIHNCLKRNDIHPFTEIAHSLLFAKEIFLKIGKISREEEAEEVINLIRNVQRRLFISESLLLEWISTPKTRAELACTFSEVVQQKLILIGIKKLLKEEMQLTKYAVSYGNGNLRVRCQEIEPYFTHLLNLKNKTLETNIKELGKIKNKITHLTTQLTEVKNEKEVILMHWVIQILSSLEHLASVHQSFLL